MSEDTTHDMKWVGAKGQLKAHRGPNASDGAGISTLCGIRILEGDILSESADAPPANVPTCETCKQRV